MKKTRAFAILLAATGLPVMGQNLLNRNLTTPAPSNYGAAIDYIQFDGNSYPSSNLICFSAGCGGQFEAHINSGNTLASPQTLVSVWCVDYQLNVTTGSQYAADVALLSNISAPTDKAVQYGTLPNANATWTNTLTSNLPAGVAAGVGLVDGGDASTAAYRYTLAAALVSQYVSNSGTPGFLDGGLQENIAIQEAIWYLTSNNTNGTDSAFPFGTLLASANVNSSDNYAYWLNKVLTPGNSLVANLDLSKWAVISGPIGPDGTVNPANVGGYNSYQTFIAEVVNPEPAFYGLLMIGLGGLFVVARRRHRNAD